MDSDDSVLTRQVISACGSLVFVLTKWSGVSSLRHEKMIYSFTMSLLCYLYIWGRMASALPKIHYRCFELIRSQQVNLRKSEAAAIWIDCRIQDEIPEDLRFVPKALTI